MCMYWWRGLRATARLWQDIDVGIFHVLDNRRPALYIPYLLLIGTTLGQVRAAVRAWGLATPWLHASCTSGVRPYRWGRCGLSPGASRRTGSALTKCVAACRPRARGGDATGNFAAPEVALVRVHVFIHAVSASHWVFGQYGSSMCMRA